MPLLGGNLFLRSRVFVVGYGRLVAYSWHWWQPFLDKRRFTQVTLRVLWNEPSWKMEKWTVCCLKDHTFIKISHYGGLSSQSLQIKKAASTWFAKALLLCFHRIRNHDWKQGRIFVKLPSWDQKKKMSNCLWNWILSFIGPFLINGMYVVVVVV